MAELFKGYEGLLVRAARQPHLTRLADEAMSTAQESFLLAIQSFDASLKIPFPAYAKAKIYGDLRTLFKRYKRQWEREVYPAENADGSSFWETVEAAGDAFTEKENKDTVRSLLSLLTPQQRTLLSLLYFKDCTQKAAAAKLGITQQAAAAMKKRALGKLREHMEMMRG